MAKCQYFLTIAICGQCFGRCFGHLVSFVGCCIGVQYDFIRDLDHL